MSSPRDEIDDWLGGEVEPLRPPLGALDGISRRARQRKARQAVVAAAGCAVVLAAAVSVPQLIGSSNHAGKPVAGGVTPASIRPSQSHSASNSVVPSARSSSPIQRPPQRTTLSNSWTIPPPGSQAHIRDLRRHRVEHRDRRRHRPSRPSVRLAILHIPRRHIGLRQYLVRGQRSLCTRRRPQQRR